MGLLDHHDLLDLDDILEDIKYHEGPADMQAIDCRRVRVLEFFFVSSRKRTFLEFQDLLDDDTPGFWGEPFYELSCSSLDDNGKHSLLLPGVSVVLQDLVRVKGYELAGLINLGDHLPITVILLASDHPGKQFIVALPGFLEVVQVPPGRLFHGNTLDLIAGSTRAGRHIPDFGSAWYLYLCTFATMCHMITPVLSTEMPRSLHGPTRTKAASRNLQNKKPKRSESRHQLLRSRDRPYNPGNDCPLLRLQSRVVQPRIVRLDDRDGVRDRL